MTLNEVHSSPTPSLPEVPALTIAREANRIATGYHASVWNSFAKYGVRIQDLHKQHRKQDKIDVLTNVTAWTLTTN